MWVFIVFIFWGDGFIFLGGENMVRYVVVGDMWCVCGDMGLIFFGIW